MKNEYLDSFNGFSKSAIEATKELVEINGRLMSKILENQISIANMFVESSEKQASKAGNKIDPKDFVTSQTALFEEYATRLTAAAQANAQLAQQAGAELKVWFEKGVKTADQAVKGAAKTAASASPIKTSMTVKTATKKPAPKKAASALAATNPAQPKKPAVKKSAAKPAAAKSATKPAAPKAAVKKVAPAKKAAPVAKTESN